MPPPRLEVAGPDTGAERRFAPPLTTIVATLGPASSDPDVVGKLIDQGAAIFRVNFSHGSLEALEAIVGTVRRVASERGQVVAVLGDLPGAKIRLRGVPAEGVEIPAGAEVVFRRSPTNEADAARLVFSSNYEGLVDDIQTGERLIIDDGAIRLLVVDRRDDEVRCTVTQAGRAGPKKGINLPDTTLRAPAITARDHECCAWAIAQELDLLAQSFVCCADDVEQLKAALDEARQRQGKPELSVPVIAKIERPAAVRAAGEILGAADGIMVARGDLGVEMDLAQVPVIQKQLVAEARRYGKPCIVATQMLQSMIESATPSRAEASDVANAILDGADAIMLSGETAVGRYPVPAVATMRRIAEATETHLARFPPPDQGPPEELLKSRSRMAALAHGVWTVADHVDARLVVAWSQSGGGARYLSRHRFSIPVVAVSTEERTLRQMQLLRGVLPIKMPSPDGLAHFTRLIDARLLELGWAQAGDPCVLLAGEPVGTAKASNTIAFHRLGDPDTGYARFGR
ncbi:MAG: pyruvate kinase [Planctomycetota bacterium]|jgi:pyruvate kinase